MGGSSTTYSSVCGELANYGFVVWAVEHRDGSGARAFINHSSEGKGSREEQETTGNVNHWDGELKHGWYAVNFIFPKQDSYDARPSNGQGIDKTLRSAQIDMHIAEAEEAYDIVKAIVQGNGASIAEQNLLNVDGSGSSSYVTVGADWESGTGKVNLMQVTMVGHSFGAATMVEILRYSDRFQWVRQGVMHDLCGLSLKRQIRCLGIVLTCFFLG